MAERVEQLTGAQVRALRLIVRNGSGCTNRHTARALIRRGYADPDDRWGDFLIRPTSAGRGALHARDKLLLEAG